MQRSLTSSKPCKDQLVTSSTKPQPSYSSSACHRSTRTSSSSSSSLVSFDQDQQYLLPTYNPVSDVAKKELSRIKSAENAVHIIPVLILLCAIILWFFSNSGTVRKT